MEVSDHTATTFGNISHAQSQCWNGSERLRVSGSIVLEVRRRDRRKSKKRFSFQCVLRSLRSQLAVLTEVCLHAHVCHVWFTIRGAAPVNDQQGGFPAERKEQTYRDAT